MAINAANNAVAPATDFLYRSPVRIAGKGFANTGPASIGAYYFRGTGGPTAGGGTGGGSGGNPIPIKAVPTDGGINPRNPSGPVGRITSAACAWTPGACSRRPACCPD